MGAHDFIEWYWTKDKMNHGIYGDELLGYTCVLGDIDGKKFKTVEEARKFLDEGVEAHG